MKITKEQAAQAKKIFEAHPKVDTLYMNNRSEYFTNESLAKHSVDDPNKQLLTIEKSVKVAISDADAKAKAKKEADAKAKKEADAKAKAKKEADAKAKKEADSNPQL